MLVVEDHPIVGSAIAAVLNYEKDLKVCGIAHDYASALEKADSLKPELVILDLSLNGRTGLQLLKAMKARQPELVVLILSVHDETLHAARSIRAGASGYVMKLEPSECLLRAIRSVLSGEIYVSPRMERRLVNLFARRGAHPGPDPLEALSGRELEVFRMIGQGKSTREIASSLCLSVKTIESHRAHVREKLGLRNASELIQHAVELMQDGSGARGPADDE
ncbi:MAG: response regulator [Verrucomicrobiia bacterium]